MNTAFALHSNYILHEFPIIMKDVQKGDIVSFLYEGEKRLALILQPTFEKKTHALVLESLNRTVLARVASQIYGKSPQVFYETYLAQNKAIRDAHGYRTFDTRKIVSPCRVLYDFGYNLANPNTMLFFGGLSVILGYDTTSVYADTYEMLNNFVKDKAKRGLYISEAPLPPIVLSYVREIGGTVNFRTWKIVNPKLTSEELRVAQESALQKLLVSGGVFFATDAEFSIFKEMLGV